MSRPVTLELASAETGYSIDALKAKTARGEIPYYLPFGGGGKVIDLDELQKLMLQNRQQTNEERQENADKLLQEMNRKRKTKNV